MADVFTMFICKENGECPEDIRGKHVEFKVNKDNKKNSFEDDISYTFFAGRNWNGNKYDDGKPKEINFTMPIGGKNNGSFRFPHYGEKILVIQQGNQYFLMSYIPNSDENFFIDKEFDELENKNGKFDSKKREEEKQKALKKADVFCLGKYKPDSKNAQLVDGSNSKKATSKIEYSTQKTFWKKKKDDADYPDVVQLDISSEGDIYTTAAGYNEVHARRVGIFSGVNLEDFKENKGNEGLMRLPFDNPDAGPSFQQGDIQVRANKRLVLKAGEGIDIQCGRSIIRIDDTGIEIKSAKIDPAYPLEDDSTVLLSSRRGVDVLGSNLNLRAGIKYSISENIGGNISSFAGVSRIESPNLQLSSCSVVSAGIAAGTNIINWITQGSNLTDALDRKKAIKGNIEKGTNVEKSWDDGNAGATTTHAIRSAASTVVSGFTGYLAYREHKTNKTLDAEHKTEEYAVGVTDLGLGIIQLLFSVKEAIMSNMDKKHKNDSEYRSKMTMIDFNVSLALVTIMDIFAVYDEVRGAATPVQTASISLVAGGGHLEAGTATKGTCLSDDKSSGPMMGMFASIMGAASGVVDIVSGIVNNNTDDATYEELKTL